MSNALDVETVPGQPFIGSTREFDAPVAAVFAAHGDPAVFARWIGPNEEQTRIMHWDFRSGGGYRYEQDDPDGQTYAFRGVFHTVRENELIIQTFEFEGWPDQVSIDTMRFEALPGGRARLVGHSVFPSAEAVEAMVSEGMERGMSEGYDKLDAILAGEG